LIWLLPGIVPLAQQFNVLVLNPSQDARYMFGAYMVAVAMLPVAMLSRRSLLAVGVDAEIDEDDDSSDETVPDKTVEEFA
jgi:hypothetical protein